MDISQTGQRCCLYHPQFDDMTTRPVIELLPYDVVCNIVSHVNIGCINQAIMVFGRYQSVDWKQKIRDMRLDPKLYFRALTDRPQILLTLMRMTKTVLSGSMAVNYFVPGSCNADSDWDFYCEDFTLSVATFMYWSSLLGVAWETHDERTEPEVPYDGIGLQLVRGEIRRGHTIHPIQLMWRRGSTATHCITRFHSTVPQCFIAGFGAVSLYHQLTSTGKGIVWRSNDIVPNPEAGDPEAEQIRARQCRQYERNRLAIEKYKGRGFQFTDYRAHYKLDTMDWDTRRRHIYDCESFVLGFKPYIHTATWSNEYYQLMSSLVHVRWQQAHHMTAPDHTYYTLLRNTSIPWAWAQIQPGTGTRDERNMVGYCSIVYDRLEKDNDYHFGQHIDLRDDLAMNFYRYCIPLTENIKPKLSCYVPC